MIVFGMAIEKGARALRFGSRWCKRRGRGRVVSTGSGVFTEDGADGRIGPFYETSRYRDFNMWAWQGV